MKRSDSLADPEEWKDYSIGGFEKGDLLKDSVFKQKNADTKHLKIGMVITFYDSSLESLNTHRIVYVHSDDNGKVDYVITQGDARAELQPYQLVTDDMTEDEAFAANAYNYQLEGSGAIENVLVTNIKGVVKSVTQGAGKVFDNIRDNYLFYFVLPVAALLILEVFLVIRNIMVLRGEKNKAELEGTREQMMSDLEKEKERMRQELLAEMRAQGLVTAETPAEETQAEEPEAEGETMDSEAVEDNNVESNEESTTEPVAEETESVEETTEDVVEDNTTEEEKKENE
ncbi:MAG: hypothetical protein K6A63_01700 [Acholeplasmatales bacterium]|nr:hypothetical protein [Acholeplasmatales bacterium]